MDATKNYDQFKFIKGNRGINPTHLKRLINSIENKNMLSSVPILVTEEMEVIDGQHRLMAAKDLGVEIYFITILIDKDEDKLKLTQMLNANIKPWAPADYLISFVELGKDEYITLRNFKEKYNLPLGLAIRYLCYDHGNSFNNPRSTDIMTKFRDGEFKIRNLESSNDLIQKINEFEPFVDRGITIDKSFIAAVTIAYKYADHKGLLYKVASTSEKLIRKPTTLSYLRDLEDIYNFRKSVKVRFFVDDEDNNKKDNDKVNEDSKFKKRKNNRRISLFI